MEYKENVTSGIRQPAIEHNNEHVYVRWGFVKSTRPATETEPEQTIWTYDEYYMPENEYYSICSGAFNGEWDDVLRGVERSYLYDEADKKIMKYTTDVVDDAKKESWITYKAAIRATQKAQGYPQQVTYPERPE